MPVHSNSRRSFASQQDKEPTRTDFIRELFSRRDVFLTDRNVATHLGCRDMNEVRPALTRLVQNGTLHWVGSRRCPTTGKRVRVLSGNS